MEASARGDDEAERQSPAPDAAGPAAAAAQGGGGAERIGTDGADSGTERQVIRWDRFLPRRSLRVLLVEHDDSTRHIVAALLRKCSYHVAVVADGLKAWDVLKEKHYNFDLVLTEVAMPSLSGIGLLSNIMAAEECKNIPVIMMSSQDSIGVVLKCMLKGAADFLVKPVRKNELRNLWQHVWRRHCSSSYAYASENHAASNHSSANVHVGSNTGENSEQGDAQSSDSKQEKDMVTGRKMIEVPLVEAGASFREIEVKAELLESGTELPANELKIYENAPAGGLAFEMNQSALETPLANQSQDNKFPYNVSRPRDANQQLARSQEGDDAFPTSHHQSESPNASLQNMIGCTDLASKTYAANFQRNGIRQEVLCEASTSSNPKSKVDDRSSMLLELSLNRSLLNGCANPDFTKKHTWNHSDSSAFSRYGDKQTYQKPVSPALYIRVTESADKSCLRIGSHDHFNENSVSLSPKELLSFDQQKAGESVQALMYFRAPSDSNKEDICLLSSGSARDASCADPSSNGADSVYHYPQFGFAPLPIPVGAIPYQSMCAGYGTILQPMFYPESLRPHNSAILEEGRVQMTSDQNCHPENHLTNHLRFIEYHHEENHQPNQWRQQMEMEPIHPGESSCTPIEHANQSGSSSHDIHKSSGSNGCETTDAVANVGNILESGNESGVQNCSRKGLDRDSRREAALMKFRLKRKDRCFEKKVRYHSRQKLAEQRPRLKGQFVRQKVPEPPTRTAAED